MVTPRRIHRSLIRARNSPSAAASCDSIVDAGGFDWIRGNHRSDRVASVVENLDGGGEEVLARSQVGGEPAQHRCEDVMTEAVDLRRHLIDIKLARRTILIIDYAGHLAVLVADDSGVAGGVLEVGGEHRRGRLFVPVMSHQRCDGEGTDERGVPRDNEEIRLVQVNVGVGETRESHGYRIAGAPLLGLLDELEIGGRAAPRLGRPS